MIGACDSSPLILIRMASSLGSAAVVVTDDLRARHFAGRIGLSTTGSVGVLIAAKEQGIVDAVSPIVTELRAAGLYPGRAALIEISRITGEALA